LLQLYELSIDLKIGLICISLQGVLNLTVAMKQLTFCLIFSVVLLIAGFTLPENIIVNNPQSGQSVQGVVEITGSVVSDTFSSAEVYYSYGNSENETWFLISQMNQKVENAVIARWDTTTISDGEYQIKVKLIKVDNSIEELIVKPVYVNNYTPQPTTAPVSTSIPIETNESATTSSGETYATPFPPNPAAASLASVRRSIVAGLILVVLTFAGLMGYRTFFNHNHLQ